jgi:hypothetical protein
MALYTREQYKVYLSILIRNCGKPDSCETGVLK